MSRLCKEGGNEGVLFKRFAERSNSIRLAKQEKSSSLLSQRRVFLRCSRVSEELNEENGGKFCKQGVNDKSMERSRFRWSPHPFKYCKLDRDASSISKLVATSRFSSDSVDPSGKVSSRNMSWRSASFVFPRNPTRESTEADVQRRNCDALMKAPSDEAMGFPRTSSRLKRVFAVVVFDVTFVVVVVFCVAFVVVVVVSPGVVCNPKLAFALAGNGSVNSVVSSAGDGIAEMRLCATSRLSKTASSWNRGN